MPARFPVRLLLLLVLIGLVGCNDHLVGTHDVILTYALAKPAASADDLRDHVRARLAAGEVTADLDTDTPSELRVRVDEDLADEVDHLVLWPGGLAVARVDDVPGFVSATGRRDTIAHDVREHPSPAGHLTLVQPIAAGQAQSWLVAWPPSADLATEVVSADGKSLVVRLTSGEEAALDKLAGEADAPFAVVRDRTALTVTPLAELRRGHELVIPVGTTIAAYTEAADVARVLATPRLPAMTKVGEAPADRDWSLAIANLVLPFVLSFAWLFFVRRFDRAQPEPMWLVVATFALGALAVVPAGILEWGWDALSPYTNPTLLTLGRAPRAFPIAFVGFVVTVGLSEEASKLLAVWSLAYRRREFDEPVDGMVYGAAAALGFAAVENVRYLGMGRVAGALVVSRAFMSVPAHLFFGTIWGYALGRRLVMPNKRVWPLFLLAITMHGLFDVCLSIDGGGLVACAVNLLVASIFVVHLRRALRYGAVGQKAGEDRGARELFRMGSRSIFAGFVVLVYFFSAVVFLLGLVWEGGHDTGHGAVPTFPFGVASTIALGLLGWAARGLAATLPLDVVVDDVGVTFAGAAIQYRDVLRIERRRLLGPGQQEQMVIVAGERELTLGPASRETIDALSHAMAMRLSSVALRS